MEEIDCRIVSLLSRNGRMSFTELARQAGLSVSAVHQRVRRLENEGVITGYVALCDPEVIGLPLTAFVSIKPFDAAAPDDLPDRLRHLSAIEACHSVAGEENYILKVRVASPAELENLLQKIRGAANVSTRTRREPMSRIARCASAIVPVSTTMSPPRPLPSKCRATSGRARRWLRRLARPSL